MYLPHNHFMAPLQTQALHSEHHFLEHAWQGVGEGNLGCHLLTSYSFSQRLEMKVIENESIVEAKVVLKMQL